MSIIKQTPLTHIHKQLGAKMAPFAGYEMPIEYSGIKDEHFAVRKAVGIFDVSHMGAIWVTGSNALEYLQSITTNDVSRLVDGKAQYSCFPNGKGGIVDDIIVYKYSSGKYYIVVNASNVDKDHQWMLKHKIEGVTIDNTSGDTAQLAVQGPKAIEVMKKLTDLDVAGMKSFTLKEGVVAGCEKVIVSTTGYTGAGGVELYFYKQYAEKIWNALLEAGKEFGIKPIGLGARDTLRLEMGYNLYGNDINDETSPIEAGLAWVTKLENKTTLVDKAMIEDQLKNGVSKKLVGIEMIDLGIPRHDYPICTADGKEIGKVTSGSISPMLNIGIGMGYVIKPYFEPDTEIFISIRGKLLKARVVKPPFYKA